MLVPRDQGGFAIRFKPIPPSMFAILTDVKLLKVILGRLNVSFMQKSQLFSDKAFGVMPEPFPDLQKKGIQTVHMGKLRTKVHLQTLSSPTYLGTTPGERLGAVLMRSLFGGGGGGL